MKRDAMLVRALFLIRWWMITKGASMGSHGQHARAKVTERRQLKFVRRHGKKLSHRDVERQRQADETVKRAFMRAVGPAPEVPDERGVMHAAIVVAILVFVASLVAVGIYQGGF